MKFLMNIVNKLLCPSTRGYTASRFGGFSIIETIVAIAVLSFAMAAPMTLAQRGLNSSTYAKDQVTAFYLAQEAVEYVRNVRDNNNYTKNSQSTWLSDLGDCISSNGCGIDVTDNNPNQRIFECGRFLKDCQLTFNPSTGIYGVRRNGNSGNPANGWKDTIFTRKLTITRVPVPGDPDAEADIVATVTWKSGLIQRSLTVNEKLFNWYPPN